MKKSLYLSLILITLIGAVFRMYRLGEVPVGLHRDEAFLGYNAFSLLKNGTDMTGKPFPLHFESFLYSPAGYSYLSVPFISLFSLSPFSVRFASAFFGTLTIPLSYFLIQQLFKNSKQKELLGLFSAAILAIVPWHINLSRTATENVVIVFFITAGIYAFLLSAYANKKKSKNSLIIYVYLLLSFACFSLSLTIYQAPRAFLPLFIPGLILYGFFIHSSKKNVLLSAVLFLVFIVIPVVAILQSKELATRMRTVSIFSTEKTQLVIDEQIRNAGMMNIPPVIARLLHNKIIGYSESFISNIAVHLSFPFLFTDQGLPDRYRVPYSGILPLSVLPLLILGFIWLWNNHKPAAALLTLWVFLSIFGSALTYDDIPNLQRTLIVFPALTIIAASGLLSLVQKKNTGKIIAITLTCILMMETGRYVYNYYVQQIVYRPWYRQEGYKTLVSQIRKKEHTYNKIIATNRESAPAIFFLFFMSYDPKTYIMEVKNSTLRDFDRVHFSKYIFSEEECPFKEITSINPITQKEETQCYGEKQTLYVNAGTCHIPTICGAAVSEIRRNDGTRVFTLVEAK